MDCGISQLFGFIKAIIIKITVDPVRFVFMEISKFALVLVLAFWITVGIFLMWESIMPEAARRLSVAAAAVVANSAGLLPQEENKDLINEQGNYPFVVDLPNANAATSETNVKEEAKEQQSETLPLELNNETPNTSAKEPEALSLQKESTIGELLQPVETSTPKNSVVDFGEQETATVPEEQPTDKPTEAAQ